MKILPWTKAAFFFLFSAVAFTAATYWKPTQLLADTRPKVGLEAMFPKSFGPWQTDIKMPTLLVSPDQQTLIQKLYSETLSRTYINTHTGERIMLSVAYGTDQSEGTKAHLPEVCYPAQGFQVLSKQKSQIMADQHTLPVQQLLTRLGNRTEPVTYWVVVGEHIALTSPQQKWEQLNYSTRGYIPDGMLVRVSNIDTDSASSYRLHQEFVNELAAAFSPDLKKRAFGTTAS